MSSDSEAEQESFVEHPSDSSRRHYRDAITGSGLGLTFGSGGGGAGEDSSVLPPVTPSSLNLQSVVVSDKLLTNSHSVLRQILSEYPNSLVVPESTEFYAVCERALSILIPAYPNSTVAELAVAVNRAIDEILATPSSPVSQKRLSPIHQIPKFTKQGSGSGYLGSGRPVSIILEEESDSERH
ncbi:hypothetical protein LPJ73_009111 [Coemansia sp. RSA 2703]|nr:hypothetical protein LPJ73_009116 [Coemansia sp. RSA 2703]KAJ1826008.1 hypothetical protein LPJ73_009111 [Coemansia sp. RSA 2703]